MTSLSPTRRDTGLDALRACLTLLVVFHHAALTYGALGGWYYREVPTDGRLETKLLIFFCTFNQAFFMGLFFLLAGYFTPRAIARHGSAAYIRERILRLGVPLLVYCLVISPFTIALAQTARGRPFLRTWAFLYENARFESGPLWFVETLLIFAAAAALWRVRPTQQSFPSSRTMAVAALATGVGAFVLRLVWPVGTTVSNLQLGYFASYIILFAAGCAGASSGWLTAVPDHQRRLWGRIAWLAVPVLPAVVLLAPVVPAFQGDTSGGWNVQAVVYACWEPLVAWGVILALLRRFDRAFGAPVWAKLSRRAYAIYIVHPPVLVAVALAWRDVSAPHLVKFSGTGTVACLACYALAGLVLRVPAIRRIV